MSVGDRMDLRACWAASCELHAGRGGRRAVEGSRGGDSVRLKLAERAGGQGRDDVLAPPASAGTPTLAQEHTF
jgi:hypothetical protein